ncbi:MAG: tetratricopeptide repeat protein [Candidatus Delongbacteria bacterium]|nr:tetratricopeptide repeat protein [Candidatus Delongbacteria bacterium]MBN2835102.1 tetratricopeptide repeat protein [Candidatus Delongbacteria bacterium]
MISKEKKEKIIRIALNSSIYKASLKYNVSYNTLKKWICERDNSTDVKFFFNISTAMENYFVYTIYNYLNKSFSVLFSKYRSEKIWKFFEMIMKKEEVLIFDIRSTKFDEKNDVKNHIKRVVLDSLLLHNNLNIISCISNFKILSGKSFFVIMERDRYYNPFSCKIITKGKDNEILEKENVNICEVLNYEELTKIGIRSNNSSKVITNFKISTILIQIHSLNLNKFGMKYVITAYDLKNNLLNMCFTFQRSKTGKILYMLFLNYLYSKLGIEQIQFVSDIKIDNIMITPYTKSFDYIRKRVKRKVKSMERWLDSAQNESDFKFKALIYLADYNFSLKHNIKFHMPFILDKNISFMNLFNKSIKIELVDKVSEKLIKEFSQVKLDLSSKLKNEKISKFYDYLNDNKFLGTKIKREFIENASMSQLMGDLNNSEYLLKIILKGSDLDEKSKILAMNAFGMLNFRKGNYSRAEKSYKMGLKLAKQSNENKLEFDILKNQCSMLIHQNKHLPLEKYIKNLEKLSRKIDENIYYSSFHYIAAHFYYAIGNLDMATQHYHMGIESIDEKDSSLSLSRLYAGLANCFVMKKMYKKALSNAMKALELSKKVNLKVQLLINQHTVALCYASLHNFKEAKIYIDKNLDILKELEYPILEYQTRELKIKIHMQLGMTALVKSEMKKIEKVYSTINNPYITNSYNQLLDMVRVMEENNSLKVKK